jgi:putative ABC transport system permease protein
VLGVLIGVITVILVASILTGLRGRIVSMIEEFGTTNIYAFHLNTGVQIGRRPRKELERKPLQIEYVRVLKTRCDAVQDVGVQLFPRRLPDRSIKFQGENFYEGSIEGITPNIHEVAHHELAMGRFLSEADNLHRQFNCVIGYAIYEALFPHMQPIGKDILIAGKRFRVVGVLQKRKSTFLGENQEDKTVSIPMLTLQKISPQDDWLFFIIQARSGQLAPALDQVEQVLRAERRLKSSDENDFSLSTADSVIQQFDQVVAGIGIITIAISGVGLLVGGIGVMNIMLVSVRERTREIGVRKALGARNRDITVQFLIEAMTLTGFGGVLGIVLATGLGLLISALVPDLPSTIPLWAVTSAFTLSVLIGLVFGVWPATRAARLDPIEALRYE